LNDGRRKIKMHKYENDDEKWLLGKYGKNVVPWRCILQFQNEFEEEDE